MPKKNKINITHVGMVTKISDSDSFYLDELMKKFQSAKRYQRERIFDGYNRKDAVDFAKPKFLDNVRYMRDTYLEAESSIESQKELLPLYIEELSGAVAKLENKIKKLAKSSKSNKDETIKAKRARIDKLTKKLNYFKHHHDNGTVPKMVDGSKKKLELLNKGKISKDEWRDLRSNAIYSRGENSKGGNENIKIEYDKDNLFKIKVLNPLIDKKNSRLELAAKFPDKFTAGLINYLNSGKAYSVRIKRDKSKYYIHLTLEYPEMVEPDFSLNCAGIDINPDNIAATIVDKTGNFIASKVFKFPEIPYVSSNKRSWIIKNKVIDAFDWIKSYDAKTVMIEDLNFKKKHSTSSKYNRMSHNFLNKKTADAVILRAFKDNIAIKEVSPQYTSLIGEFKYAKMYGLSTHQSAALVIARRGMGYSEKVPKKLLSDLFAGEAKKGQQIDSLKLWSKIYGFKQKCVKIAIKKKVPYRHWYLKDYLIFSKALNLV